MTERCGQTQRDPLRGRLVLGFPYGNIAALVLVDPTPAGLAIACGRDILPALVDPLVQDAVKRRQEGFEWWTEREGEW